MDIREYDRFITGLLSLIVLTFGDFSCTIDPTSIKFMILQEKLIVPATSITVEIEIPMKIDEGVRGNYHRFVRAFHEAFQLKMDLDACAPDVELL